MRRSSRRRFLTALGASTAALSLPGEAIAVGGRRSWQAMAARERCAAVSMNGSGR